MGDDAEFVDPRVLGTLRSWPTGSLPYLADRLDASGPPAPFEAEVDVELVNLDATSHRQIRRECEGDPDAMAARVLEIVAARSKMHNPVTNSGGVLAGRLSAVGPEFWQPGFEIGQRVVPLVSLVALPLTLDDVGPLDPDSPQFPARGRAIVTGRMSLAPVPDDLPFDAALTAFDVFPVASHTRSLAKPGDHVVIVGSGHAGLAAAVAAREAIGPGGHVTLIDRDPAALARADSLGVGARTIAVDATDAAAVMEEFRTRRLGRSDLTLSCANVPGCEGSAIVLTRDAGTVLFFSTATSFAAAGLGADSLSSLATLTIPNGYTEDHGQYLIELLRRTPSLLACFRGG